MSSVNTNERDHYNPRMSKNSQKNERSRSSTPAKTKSSAGPAVVLLWMWNWFAALPKTVTNLYADFKSGELLARFTLLDAMCQFIVAVATSCHPQEEPSIPEEDEKENISQSPSKMSGVRAFQGTPRSLRSRTVEAN